MSTEATPAVADTSAPATQKKKVSLYETYETDKSAEERGAKVEVLPGVIFRIRSRESLIVRNWLQKRIRKNRQQYNANNGVLPPELQDQQDIDQLAEVIVIGWEGDVTDKSGALLEHSTENARKLFRDLPHLRRDLMFASGELETFRKSDLDDIAKN